MVKPIRKWSRKWPNDKKKQLENSNMAKTIEKDKEYDKMIMQIANSKIVKTIRNDK